MGAGARPAEGWPRGGRGGQEQGPVNVTGIVVALQRGRCGLGVPQEEGTPSVRTLVLLGVHPWAVATAALAHSPKTQTSHHPPPAPGASLWPVEHREVGRREVASGPPPKCTSQLGDPRQVTWLL